MKEGLNQQSEVIEAQPVPESASQIVAGAIGKLAEPKCVEITTSGDSSIPPGS